MRLRVKSIILVLMILIVLVYALLEIRPSKTNPRVPAWHGVLQCMSIAISDLKYGLEGNVGYRKVYNIIYPSLERGDAGIPIETMNKAINKTLSIEDVSASGIHYIIGTGTANGMIDFMKLSFILFGFQAESFFYLYMVLLIIPVLLFIISFRNNLHYLFIGFLFLICYQLIASTSIVKFETILHVRFIALLTILPTIHLALLVMDKHKFALFTLIGALIQASILLFSFYIRSHSRYQFMFLASLPIFLFIYNKIRFKTKVKLNQFWPLAVVLASFLLFQMYLSFIRDSSITDKESAYPVWHQTYIGLAGHPQAKEKYGIEFSDANALRLVIKRAAEKGNILEYNDMVQNVIFGIDPEKHKSKIILVGVEYENIIRKEFFKILINDPLFVISSYFYKIPTYIKAFLSGSKNASFLPESYGNVDGLCKLFNPFRIAVIIFIAFLFSRNIVFRWKSYFHLLLFNLVFALIPPIVTLPACHSILDSVLLLSIIFYSLLAISIIALKRFLIKYFYHYLFFYHYQR